MMAPDAIGKLGCPVCGYVFSDARACPVCHRGKCRCKPRVSPLPILLQTTIYPGMYIGHCPGCARRVGLMTDTAEAVKLAQAASLRRHRASHLAGHRGRSSLTCVYCQRGHPLGIIREGESLP